MPRLRFAGQITGVEGYVESAATGLVAGRLAAAERLGMHLVAPTDTTALGALVNHITGGHLGETADEAEAVAPETVRKPRLFQPMNVNFGLFPDMPAPSRDADGRRLRGKDKSRAKKRLMTARALEDLTPWLTAYTPTTQAAE